MVSYTGTAKIDPLAQLVEHLTFNQGVWSSNLRWVTKNRVRHQSCPVFVFPRRIECNLKCTSPNESQTTNCFVPLRGTFRDLRWVTTCSINRIYEKHRVEFYTLHGVFLVLRQILFNIISTSSSKQRDNSSLSLPVDIIIWA